MSALHISPYAGTWYPAGAAELESLLDELFAKSRGRAPYLYQSGIGFIVPHAGPLYSGAVAAAVYRCLEQVKPERVVLLAFPHRGGLRGVAAPDVDAVATPLGAVAIDASFGGFPLTGEQRVCDHSFEIQLPFLQKAAPQALVTPLYVGRMDAGERSAAADALARLWRPGTVFVASSDFTHYGRSFGFTPFPPARAAEGGLRDLDTDCIEAAGTLDSGRFLDRLEQNGATVCGTDPIALLLDIVRRLDPGMYQATLDYQTSGELTGDFHHSVSYAALGFFPRAAFDVDAACREALLDSVATTLCRLRASGEKRVFPAEGSPALAARRGVFVTLRQGEELLGCMGNLAGRAALAEDVAQLALAAAMEDPRFRPAASVAGPIDIEISLLTPFRGIRGAGDVLIGRHGVFLKLGGHAGLLLPQVASEREWDAAEFLLALTRKCSLGPNAWRDPKARLYVFEAQVFSRDRAVP
jgi:MEMO1 family protein